MRIDPTGRFFISLIVGLAVTALICGVVAGSANMITAVATGQVDTMKDAWAAFAGGFVNGAISGIGIGISLAVPGGFLVGALLAGTFGFAGGYLGSVVEEKISTGEVNWKDRKHFISGAASAILNIATFGLSKYVMSNIGEQLTGSFFNRLTDVLKPSCVGYVLNGVFGIGIALIGTIANTIDYYVTGGTYRSPYSYN